MSLVIDSWDKIRGDATTAAEVDCTIYGIDDTTRKQLYDGQLANAIGDLYTADSTDTISSIILVNTGAAHNHVNLYLTPSGGTARRLISKDLQLEPGYTLIFTGVWIGVFDTNGSLVAGTNVSDTAYAATWDGVTMVAPSKNAVYDALLQTLLTAAGDTVYASAANVLARLAKGAANTRLFMNAGATVPEWAIGIKQISSTYDTATASGNQDITGFGFIPSHVCIIADVDSTCQWSISFHNGTLNDGVGGHFTAGLVIRTSGIFFYQSAGAYVAGIVTFLSDGIRIAWTKVGAKTGTADLEIMAWR